ncbi:MAG: D-alanine--D-alanine ligase [Planctomycetes bacterium]|nr:D-alanine--D-alanine ligase [Planctomycetota bacterium]
MNAMRIAVLGGGISTEHDVSVRSRDRVAEALASRGHEIQRVHIARDGLWSLRGGPPRPPLVAMHELARVCDCVFPALHGRGGEDGFVQALASAAGIPCALSGLRASSIGMSKALTRACFVGAGLPMAPAFLPTRREARTMSAADITRRAAELGLALPWFLKEEDSGSSLGVERIDAPADFESALGRVRELGPHWILEAGIAGIEITCAVLGNAGAELRALPVVEIRPKSAAFFDYEAKYDAAATDELCPAPSLDAHRTAEVQSLAVRAHDLLGCLGLSRTDMIVGHDGNVVVLETNTIPGLTAESLVPKAARAAGMEFAELLEELVALAMRTVGYDAPFEDRVLHDARSEPA